ncbi:hypothetical protein [Sphaerimonospora thailandensis]|uniref:Uncharacterized protein n=1 Tax=Sphaerimonospora thailandensis TaxID=795644 RepID=A0A8J3R8Q8_9ACTN|nr:hypothetical protein Mth01_20840 [Sphaerimonospora thailandensis]
MFKTLFDLRNNRSVSKLSALACTVAVGASLVAAAPAPVAPVVKPVNQTVTASDNTAPMQEEVLLRGTTLGSYFWDDASGRQGDTGLPAIGLPMQKGMFASPSWPLGTEGYIFYKGKKAPFFIGDRGPGVPSESGVMLDIDGKTFAELVGESWNEDSLTVSGDEGHIQVDYVVTKWGDGPGTPGEPLPFSSGAWQG